VSDAVRRSASSLSNRPVIVILITRAAAAAARLVQRRVVIGQQSGAPAARAARRLQRSPRRVQVLSGHTVARVGPHRAAVVLGALALPRPVTGQHRHHLHGQTRRWRIADSAPGTARTTDSASIDARPRLGHYATNTTQQGR